MTELLNSQQFQLKPKISSYLREEIFISAFDAHRIGLNISDQYCIFAITPLFPGPSEEEYAVHVVVDQTMEPGAVMANQEFLDHISFRPDDQRFWSLKRAPSTITVQKAVIESVVEHTNAKRKIDHLNRQRKDLLVKRCLLMEPDKKVSDLTLPIKESAYFNFRSLHPLPQTKSILIFDENTTFDLFIPHRKSGVDMVIVIDASGSMDLPDYLGTDNRPHSRIEGVRYAMDVLLQRRLTSGTRVSSIAAIVFGQNTRMLYPLTQGMMVELKDDETQINEVRRSIRHLSHRGLELLQVDRNHTNISGALRYAAELLDYYAQEGNEKMLVLLSDGADWAEISDDAADGEVVSTFQNPAVLADSLHFDSKIRIHTVAISDEQALRKYAPPQYWNEGWAIPNTPLLKKIADSTAGIFIESPDANALAKLFDELGEGAMYPV